MPALLTLPPRSPKLNGAVERANRTHTEEFYEVTDAAPTLSALQAGLRDWEVVYNTSGRIRRWATKRRPNTWPRCRQMCNGRAGRVHVLDIPQTGAETRLRSPVRERLE